MAWVEYGLEIFLFFVYANERIHCRAPEFTDTLHQIFGDHFPYITTVGDHDLHEEGHYRDFFTSWNRGVPGLECEGQWGVMSVCRYKGIVFFGMGVMFHEADFDRFLDTEMPKYRLWPWKVCFWHRVATEFQPVDLHSLFRGSTFMTTMIMLFCLLIIGQQKGYNWISFL